MGDLAGSAMLPHRSPRARSDRLPTFTKTYHARRFAMNAEAIAPQPTVSVHGNWPWRIAVVAVLTALADWLFFRQVVGVSFALFVLAVGAGVLATNRIDVNVRAFLLHAGILAAAVLPVLEDFNVMSALIALVGIVVFALGVWASLNGDVKEEVIAIAWFLLSAPFQFFRDLPIIHEWARERGAPVNLNLVKGWILPLTFGAIFLSLFPAANPLINNWLMQWKLGETLKLLDMQRLMFWIGAIIAMWSFICVSGRFARPYSG